MSADWLPASTRSRIMRSIRSKDTAPERTVRKALFADGYRYRLHSAKLPGKPDLVFPCRKKVIFIHGCFWHQHTDSRCTIAGKPTSNTSYWGPKLKRNIVRDIENEATLKAMGWKVRIAWECELENDLKRTLSTLRKFLGPPKVHANP